MLRWVAGSAILFAAGSVVDNLLTYWFVVAEGRFFEANPFTAPFIYSQPLYMWFVRAVLFYLFAVAIGLVYRYLMHFLSRGYPPDVRAEALKMASRWWVIPFVVAVIRILPVIHNTLALLGIETPLPRVYDLFGGWR